MNEQVKVGDSVQLNSGSPDMRIVAIDPHVTVEWQDGDQTRSAVFPMACVQKKSN